MSAQAVRPGTVLTLNAIRLEPLAAVHTDGLREAAADGRLWEIFYTDIPAPGEEAAYIQTALDTPNRFAFAVINSASARLLGTTSYYEIDPAIGRLEIGYTWYAQSHWRSALNTTCKYLLLGHAFDTLGYRTVCWRTDILNTRSQQAIERLGALKDGIIRGERPRKDGSVRDTVMYSMTADEWPARRARLAERLGLSAPFQAA